MGLMPKGLDTASSNFGVLLCVALLLVGCSDSSGNKSNATSGIGGTGSGSLPAVYRGTWANACRDADPDDPGREYVASVAVIEETTVETTMRYYADNLCTHPTVTGHHYSTLMSMVVHPAAVQIDVGAAVAVDFTMQRSSLDGGPSIEVEEGVVEYDLLYLSGSNLFFGDLDNPQTDGTSAAKRPVQIDSDFFYTRQQ